jgi:ABC-type Fe3+-siderophore transport system permease subunit
MWFGIKLPRYYPTEHTWKWIKEKGIPSQGWYSMQAFAFLTAGIVSIIVYVIFKRNLNSKTYLKPALTKTLGVVTTLIIVICMSYILYHEFHKWGVFASLGWQ